MRDNTQNGGGSSILDRTTPKPLETRQISLDLPCTDSEQLGWVECEKEKKLKKTTPPQTQNKESLKKRVPPNSSKNKKTYVFEHLHQSESFAICAHTSDRQNHCQKEKSRRRRSESFSISQKRDHTQSELDISRPYSVRVSSDRKKQKFFIFEHPPYLQIQGVPIPERVDPARLSYILVIQPIGVRACGGQYSAEEAHEIARLTKSWDWRPDSDGRPRCLGRLEVLLDGICKRSGLGNEASESGHHFNKKDKNEGGEV
jgi:hypothetical protein